jgi:hypothetical protein
MGTGTAWSTPLTPQPPRRGYRQAAGIVVAALVAVAAVFVLGPSTLVDCSPSNPFDRIGVWASDGHVDSAPGAPSCQAPHPVTWIVIGLVVAAGLVLAARSLRRR